MNIELYLPFAPTVNNYYVKTSRGVFISQKGRKYREAVAESINMQLGDIEPIAEKILIEVILFMPDKRKRDLDNYMKSLLDACTQAGLWEDDSLIDQLFIYRGELTSPSGGIYLKLAEAAPVLPIGYRL